MLSDHLPFDTKHLCREGGQVGKEWTIHNFENINDNFENIFENINANFENIFENINANFEKTLKISMTTLKRTLTISQNTRRPYWQPTTIFPSWIVEHNT